MTRRRRDLAVGRDERCVERFRERNIRCVVRGEVGAKLPDSLEQISVSVASEGEVRESPQRQEGTVPIQQAGPLVTPQDLGDLEIEQVWRVYVLGRTLDPKSNPRACIGDQQELDRGGRVENDQRESLSARTASAGDGCTSTRPCERMRSRISA